MRSEQHLRPRAPRARRGMPLREVPVRAPTQVRTAREGAVVELLASLIETRRRAHGGHAARVADRSVALLRALTGTEPDAALRTGFVLHDIGQILVPETILLKAGPLEPEELDLMRRHPAEGVRLLEPLGFPPSVLEIVGSHHERWDGSGYPRGLRGERIPLAARAFAVVDAYDSMTNVRPYRRAMDHACSTAELRSKAGKQFDPACVDAFVALALG